MFLDNLSASLLKICDAEHLSYEQASERCGCSSTPNDLMGIVSQKHLQLLTYRSPMPVVTVHFLHATDGDILLPVCPQCGNVLKWDHQAYCSSCGQCLSWDDFDDAFAAFRP